MKAITSLPDDLRSYLYECCDETGHGSFCVKSNKAADSVQITLEATPSQRYEGDGGALVDLLCDSSSGKSNLRTARSLNEVSDRIVRRLVEIWDEANGNGCVEVGCRRQQNGKVRIRIRHSCDDEVVLRPEEIQVSIPSETSITK